MPDAAITCEYCRKEPATTLLVFDVGAKDCRAPIRVKSLIGDNCHGKTKRRDLDAVAVTPPSAWAWTLTPVGEMTNA